MVGSVFPYVICDVFTDRPLAGNQLGVFSEAAAIPERLLQPLARELNFSETVFAYPPSEAGVDARVRIFTPQSEVPFAGHPVLGAAVVLGAARGRERIVLETGMGPVPVEFSTGPDGAASGWMRQPLPTVSAFAAAEPLLAALGVERSLLPVELYDNGLPNVYVTLADEAAVAGLAPDLRAVARVMTDAGQAVAGVNCFAGAGLAWKTRMFAPADGVPEDPATGSAAGPLACHLLRHGLLAAGAEIRIAQGAELGRPSILRARVRGSGERIEAVEVGGSAVIVADGAFRLPGSARAARRALRRRP